MTFLHASTVMKRGFRLIMPWEKEIVRVKCTGCEREYGFRFSDGIGLIDEVTDGHSLECASRAEDRTPDWRYFGRL